MIYVDLPYVSNFSPHGIHLRTARLPLTTGYPVFVGPYAERMGILSHVGGKFYVGGLPLGFEAPNVYLDLRTRAGLFYAAEWLAFPGVHDLLLGSKPERAPALAYMLYLRKLNGLWEQDVEGENWKNFIGDGECEHTRLVEHVKRGMIHDTGSRLYGIISKGPIVAAGSLPETAQHRQSMLAPEAAKQDDLRDPDGREGN